MVENLWLNKLLVSLYFVSEFFEHDVFIDDDGAATTLDSVESSRVRLLIPRPSKKNNNNKLLLQHFLSLKII